MSTSPELQQPEPVLAQDEPSPPAKRSLKELRPIIIQTVIAAGVVVGIVVLAAIFFRDPLTRWGEWMVAKFGLPGLLVGIALSDIFSFPIPPDTFLFIAATTKMPVFSTLATISAVSVACGSIAYKLGPFLSQLPFLRKRVERWRPRGEALFRHWGVWTVAIGALSPLPYAMTCWFAGIYKMPYRRFVLATLFRIPRLVAYYYLFVLGWLPGS